MGEACNRLYNSCLILSVILLIIIPKELSAQKKVDPGIFAGTSYYMGDLNTSRHFAIPSLAVGPILRYNFNPRNSLRVHAFYHGLSGTGFHFPSGGEQEFAAKFVDLALNFEFNWWPYASANRKYNQSPYVFAGLGYGLKISGTPATRSHITIPFGLGYKVNVGRWFSAGVEAGPRKTFSDVVDGVTNPGTDDVLAPFGNRDWYIFTGVFVTYKIYKFWEDCPTYE